jgi:O-glycosyl hydrolase
MKGQSQPVLVFTLLLFLASAGASQPRFRPAGETHPPSLSAATGETVTVTVDNGISYQTMEGFGASTRSWSACGNDRIGPMRRAVLDAVYNQVKLNMGDIHAEPYEGYFNTSSACDWKAFVASNDNDDPYIFNWARFQWWRSDYDKTALVDIARPMGFDDFILRGAVATRVGGKWLLDIRKKDYKLYLHEAAENVVAIYVHWRQAYGIVPRWDQPFNEPTSGNQEVWGASSHEIVDLVKAIGARFRREGFDQLKLAVPSETNEERSLETARAILADSQARQYVGAISYHPYGSVYGNIPRILATSGAGRPDPRAIAVRKQIRDLARKYHLQAWMTEVCCGDGNTAFDRVRARAIHIHDELVYADASAYWGMWNMWSELLPGGEGTVLVFDPRAQTFRITGIGYAIGHYARWIERGAVRIEGTSSDPLLLVTAFRDDPKSRIVLVIINNAAESKTLEVNLKGVSLTGNLAGEQSTAAGFWKPLASFRPASPSGFTMQVPGLSVTSIAGPFAGSVR